MRICARFFSSNLLECARFKANERVDCLSAGWVLDFFVATMVKVRVKEDVELFPYSALAITDVDVLHLHGRVPRRVPNFIRNFTS